MTSPLKLPVFDVPPDLPPKPLTPEALLQWFTTNYEQFRRSPYCEQIRNDPNRLPCPVRFQLH